MEPKAWKKAHQGEKAQLLNRNSINNTHDYNTNNQLINMKLIYS